MTQHEIGESYDGPITIRPVTIRDVTIGDVTVDATLRGAFQPIDGRFHWYGRLTVSAALDELGAGSTVTVTTGHGSATGRLSDVDPWGRLRVTGVGTPPF